MKTFWGWRDKQLPDGTVIWELPDGHTYVTTPGSALLFPALCAPTGEVPALDVPVTELCGERTAMMPLRATTRAQNRTQRIAAERRQNREVRMARHAEHSTYVGPPPPGGDDDPPPF